MSLQMRNQSSGILEKVAGFNDTDAVLSPVSRNPIQNKAVYTALAQKIEKTVSDLINYYTKDDVYNKREVRDLIGAINTLTIEVVNTLPTSDISTTTIYFLKNNNIYDEYIYVENNWVKIGDTDIDLSGYITSNGLFVALNEYYTKTELDNLISNYYTKTEVNGLLDNYYTSTEVDTALNAKQNKLTFDTTPTASSTNPVTSGGVKDAIDAIPSNPVDSIINGDMHAITSNAIFDYLTSHFKPTFSTVVTNTSIDLNNVEYGGFADFLVSPSNPNSCGSYGYLMILRYGSSNSPNLCQVHFPYHSSDKFAIRCRYSGSWTAWKSFGEV